MPDIEALRRSSLQRKQELQTKTNKSKTAADYKDDRFWTLDYNKDTKVGKAIIRPIGPAMNESDEFVNEYTHFIRKNNKILSLNCPTTVGQKCPICEYYFSKDKDERDPNYTRNTKYIMNILVVNDFQHPENNGKVFLYRCPVSIMSKIEEALKDTDEMDQPKESVNVFDMWEGANVNLITKDKGGWLNYDSSYISSPSPIFEDVNNTAAYEGLYKKLYQLKEFKVAPSTDEVREKFDAFMSNVETSPRNLENHLKAEQKAIFATDNIEDVVEDKIPDFGVVPSPRMNEPTNVVTTSEDFWNDFN